MSPDKNAKLPSKSENLSELALVKEEEDMTIGQTRRATDGFEPWRKWATNMGHENALQLLFEVFHLKEKEVKQVPFVNIFNTLSSPYSLEILESWSNESELCRDIYQLILAKLNVDDRADSPFQTAAPVSKSFLSSIKPEKHYLLLVFTQGEIFLGSDNEKSLILLKVWILIQAIDQMSRDILWDKRLRSVCSYVLRFIENKSGDVSDHLWSMLRHFEVDEIIGSFQKLNRLLVNRINAEATIDTISRRFINVITAVAVRDYVKYVPSDSVISSKNFNQYNRLYDLTEDEALTLPYIPHFLNEEKEDENDIEYAEAPVNEEQSYTYQKLSAKSVFLTQAEYLYNLPWSWNRLTKFEEKNLNKWVTSTWKSGDDDLHFLATLTWIALNTGRTLMRVLAMSISETPEREWTLNLTRKSLMRIPPLRNNSWKPKSDEQQKWIYSTTEFNEIKLPKESLKEISLLDESVKKFHIIGKYWESISNISIERLFNEQMIGNLERVKSGYLGNHLSQACYEATGDKNLAQMIGFHPQQGLPGAFAYGSWKASEIKKITNKIHQCSDEKKDTSAELIAFGSRVNIKEDLLKEEIQKAYQKAINIDKTDDPVEFHNYYTGYLMMALWAGTGVRPVSDCFESPLHFNFDEGFVFVNDKACDERRSGRLVPIPESLIEFLKEEYTRHLILLSDGLVDVNGSLAEEIKRLVDGKPSGELPYFFFIDKKTLDWKRVHNKRIKQYDLFHWPLRSNLFRQRIAKNLPKLGVENEVVNAWLGHKDTAIDTYGDYSIRVFIDDIRSQRKNIDTSFSQLGFKSISTWNKVPIFSNVQNARFTNKDFGINRRIEKREIQHQKTKESTQDEIKEYLNGRNFNELEQVEFEALEKQLISSPGGIVRPHSFIRLSVLHAIFDEIWQEKLEKFNITRRYAKIDTDLYSVNELCPINFFLFQKLRAYFLEEYEKVQSSRVTVTDSKLLSVLALLFENRICYPQLLRDIYQGDNFRLVKYKRLFYLEYSENLNEGDFNSPVERHCITPKTAHLLNNLLGSRKSDKPKLDMSDQLFNIVNEHHPKFHIDNKTKIEKSISILSEITNSANVIELPGVVAAYLSGRVTSTSLSWVDWIRLDQNKIINIEQYITIKKPSDFVDKIFEQETIKHNSSILKKYNEDELLVAANEFIKEIHSTLKGYSKKNISKVLREIKKLNTKYDQKVSPSIILIGTWISHTIENGKKSKKGKFNPYSESTINSYFSSLTSTLVDLAYNTDLIAMDREEVTDLYDGFIKSIDKDIEYKTDRLLEFHAFCKKQGVKDPVWEDLYLPNKKKMSSPGIVTEHDYENAFNIIMSSKKLPEDDKHYMTLLLFLCFRFGLRSKEAIGLRRKDWINELSNIYIIIENNAIRKLKTNGSRRIVPLLFDINQVEKDLIKYFIGKFEPAGLKGENEGLFTDSKGNIINNIKPIRKSLIRLLKRVTGNRDVVTHHLRHSFSNVTSIPLYRLNLKYWGKMLKKEQDNTIQNIALGKNNTISTRSSMCAARLLGHTFPRTQAISYQHFIDEWANTCVGISDIKSDKKLSNVIEIDKEFKLSKTVNTDIAYDNIPEFKPLSHSLTTTLFSLVASGKSFQSSGEMLSINPDKIKVIEDIFEKINIKVYSKKSMLFLEHIPRTAWKRLYLMMVKLDGKKSSEIYPLLEISNIGNMIGKTRQITLDEEGEFRLYKCFNEFVGVGDDDITVTSFKKNTPQIDLAKNYNLKVDFSINRHHLDIWSEAKDGGRKSDNRINVIFKENDNNDIRNSYQYVACLLIFYFTMLLDN